MSNSLYDLTLKMSNKLKSMIKNRKEWTTVINDINTKIDNEQTNLEQLYSKYEDLCFIAETANDHDVQAEIDMTVNHIKQCENRLEQLHHTLAGAERAETESKIKLTEENAKRKKATIERLCDDIKEGASLLDSSFTTLTKRYAKVQNLSQELQAVTGRSSIQVNEMIKKPLMNFDRCMGSYLPHNVGTTSRDAEPFPMQPLSPKSDVIIELLKL